MHLRLHRLVQQQRLPNVFNLRNCTFEVECLTQDDFEDLHQLVHTLSVHSRALVSYLLDVDTMAGAAEDQASPHSFGVSFSLVVVSGQIMERNLQHARTCREISS